MAWLKKTTNEPVTVAYLLTRQVSLAWHEAVAIVLEVAEVFERSGKSAVPRTENVGMMPSGSVEFRRGRTQSGDAVSALARMLSNLLPRDRPTQLRLLVSTAGPDSAAYKSVKEFTEALTYFERPGRRNILSEVYQRALGTPVPQAAEPRERSVLKGRRKKRARRRRILVPVAAVLGLVAVVAGVIALVEDRRPGLLDARTEPLQSLASGAWSTALEATSEFRESAARDLSTVLERMREATGKVTPDTAAESDDDDRAAPVSTQSSRAVSPRDSGRTGSGTGGPEPDATGEGDGATLGEPATLVEAAEPETVGDPREPLETTLLFDSGDINVTPPVTLRLQLPTVADDAPWNEDVGVVEAIVSAAGGVSRRSGWSHRPRVSIRR